MAKLMPMQCPQCPTCVHVEESQVQKLLGHSITCPICAAKIPILTPDQERAAQASARSATQANDKVRIVCPSCSAALMLVKEVFLKLAGSKITCLKCNAEITVPHADAASPAVPSPAAPPAPAPTPQPSAPVPAARASTPTPVTPAPAAVHQAPAIPFAAPAGPRKCFLCGSEIDQETHICTKCGVDQKTGKPSARPSEPTAPKGKLRLQTAIKETMKHCVTCGVEIPEAAVLCDSCGTNQQTGKKQVVEKGPVGWWKVRPEHSKLGKHASRLMHAIRTVIILIVLGILGWVIYRFIISVLQMPAQ